METQSYQFQSPDSYCHFYTMDGIYPQLVNNNNNNIDDNNQTMANNIFAVSSLGADDFRKVAIPERNKTKVDNKPKSSLTMLLESRPEHPNICGINNNSSNDNNHFDHSDNNSHLVSSLPATFNLNNSQVSNINNQYDDEINGVTSNISFTDLLQLVTEEEKCVSKSQCDIYPTEEDGSVIDYLPDISKNQNILDFGLQDFVVVDKASSKPLMHVHIGRHNTPSPTLETSKNAMRIPSNPSPLPVNDSLPSLTSDGSLKDPNLSYYESFANSRERAASESCVGPYTIYYKKVGANNWSIASKNVTEQISPSTSSSTPTSVSSYHARGNQKLIATGLAKSLPEERLDSSVYSPAKSLSNNSLNSVNSKSNINSKIINSNINNDNISSNTNNDKLPKMEMMRNGPFAFCHNISSSDSSDSDDDDNNNNLIGRRFMGYR